MTFFFPWLLEIALIRLHNRCDRYINEVDDVETLFENLKAALVLGTYLLSKVILLVAVAARYYLTYLAMLFLWLPVVPVYLVAAVITWGLGFKRTGYSVHLNDNRDLLHYIEGCRKDNDGKTPDFNATIRAEDNIPVILTTYLTDDELPSNFILKEEDVLDWLHSKNVPMPSIVVVVIAKQPVNYKAVEREEAFVYNVSSRQKATYWYTENKLTNCENFDIYHDLEIAERFKDKTGIYAIGHIRPNHHDYEYFCQFLPKNHQPVQHTLRVKSVSEKGYSSSFFAPISAEAQKGLKSINFGHLAEPKF